MSFTDGLELRVSDGAATPVFNVVPKMNSLDGLGQSAPEIDVTTWESAAREYIAGKAEGDEITLNMNQLLGDTIQDQLLADAKNKTTRAFEFDVTNQTLTRTYTFEVALKTWKVVPGGTDEKHTVEITGKISGDINWTDA